MLVIDRCYRCSGRQSDSIVLKAYTVIRRGKTIWGNLKHKVGLAKGMEKKVKMIKKWVEQEAALSHPSLIRSV